VGTRSSQPSGVIIDSSKCSSACSGTFDWMNSVATAGFSPAASQSTTICQVCDSMSRVSS
jgi:hypothetical protein